jgi:hypothetical protein
MPAGYAAPAFATRATVEHNAGLAALEARAMFARLEATHETRRPPMYNVKMTGPPTLAAKPPPAVVGPCRLTCYARSPR